MNLPRTRRLLRRPPLPVVAFAVLAAGATGLAPEADAQSANCAPLAQRVRSSLVTVGGSVPASDEATPVVAAPRSDGTTVLAWSDRSAQRIGLAALGPDDRLRTRLPTLDGLEVHAALPTRQGLAFAVVTSDPTIYSPKYCRSAATPDRAVCGRLDLVRTDGTGRLLGRTTLTKRVNVDRPGASFIWWYGHTARLASDGTRLGVYFRSAMSTPRPGVPGEVDIHAGDTLRFVDAASGSVVPGGWDWGCSHSWSVRLAHDGQQWAAACHGDAYPNAMRIARLAGPTAAPSNLDFLANVDPTRRALGGLVPAPGGGFWLTAVQPEGSRLVLRLAKAPRQGGALVQSRGVTVATNLDAAYPFRAWLAGYAGSRLLLGWKSAGKLVLATADATTGALVEGPVTTTLPIDNFEEMVSAPNGDVLWATSSGGASVRLNRVAACRLGA